MFEQHGPGEAKVGLSLTDDVFLRSDTWGRWRLGIPLPVECVSTLIGEGSGRPTSCIRPDLWSAPRAPKRVTIALRERRHVSLRRERGQAKPETC